MTNLKDTITNICGLVLTIGGAVLAANVSGQITLPPTIVGLLGIVVTVAGALVAYYTGKPVPPAK